MCGISLTSDYGATCINFFVEISIVRQFLIFQTIPFFFTPQVWWNLVKVNNTEVYFVIIFNWFIPYQLFTPPMMEIHRVNQQPIIQHFAYVFKVELND